MQMIAKILWRCCQVLCSSLKEAWDLLSPYLLQPCRFVTGNWKNHLGSHFKAQNMEISELGFDFYIIKDPS